MSSTPHKCNTQTRQIEVGIGSLDREIVGATALIQRKWSSAGEAAGGQMQPGPGEERKREDVITVSICGGWHKTRWETHLSLTFTFLLLFSFVCVCVWGGDAHRSEAKNMESVMFFKTTWHVEASGHSGLL